MSIDHVLSFEFQNSDIMIIHLEGKNNKQVSLKYVSSLFSFLGIYRVNQKKVTCLKLRSVENTLWYWNDSKFG